MIITIILLKDTSVTAKTRTHNLLIRNTSAWVQCSATYNPQQTERKMLPWRSGILQGTTWLHRSPQSLCFLGQVPVEKWQYIILKAKYHFFFFLPFKCKNTVYNIRSRHFCNCQRPVSALWVIQHIRELTNLWNFNLNQPPALQEKSEKPNNYFHCFKHQISALRDQNSFQAQIFQDNTKYMFVWWARLFLYMYSKTEFRKGWAL